MIARLLAIAVLGGGFVGALTACSSEKDDPEGATDPTGGDDPAVTDTFDTAAGGGGADGLKQPHYLMFTAFFGWDDDAGTMVPVTVSGQEQPPLMLAVIGTEDWGPTFSLTDDENYCFVQFDLTGTTKASWTADVGMWLGFDVNTAGAADDCDDFDESLLGGDASAWASAYGYKAGLGGDVSPALAEAIESQLGASYLDLFVGGYLESDLIGGATYDTYATAYEVDANFAVVVDASGYGTYIDKYSMQSANAVVTGYYSWASPIWPLAY